MCVIIIREPGVDIPLDKLKIACEINPDGHGMAWVHKERLQIVHNVEANDPEAIHDWLQKMRKYRVYLHLRYATVGSVTKQNAHPFKVLDKKTDGMDLALFHNGTVHKYSPAWEQGKKPDVSDTFCFANQYIKPLSQRVKSFTGAKGLIFDKFYQKLVADEGGGNSKYLIVDHFNQYLTVGSWEKFDGWLASNDYSFKTTHQRFKSNAQGPMEWKDGKWVPKGGKDDTPFNDELPEWEKDLQRGTRYHRPNDDNILPWKPPTTQRTPTVIELPASGEFEGDRPTELQKHHEALRYQVYKLANIVKGAIMTATSIQNNIADLTKTRVPFLAQSGLGSLDDMKKLTPGQFEDLLERFPKAMAQFYYDVLNAMTEKDIQLKAAQEASKKFAEMAQGAATEVENLREARG